MAGSPGADAANLAIAPPAGQPIGRGQRWIEHAAVHDGAIDRPYIAQARRRSASGTKQANFNAAMGHHRGGVISKYPRRYGTRAGRRAAPH